MAPKTKNAAQERDDLIPLATAAKLIEVTPDRVRQLAREGYVEIPVRGQTTIVSVVRGYIRFLKDAAKKETKSAAASRVTEARAAEIELRIAERNRELIPQEDAILAMDTLVGVVNKELRGLPARFTRDLEVRRNLEAELHGSQERIAKALTEGKGLAATGRDASDTGSED